jgi:hypothetical protein
MPYDSATGSSGPAHQACEFGVPIVCADLPDFRDMAADEDMAISFYQVGNAVDLGDKLVAILQSPEQQRHMAEHNFSAAMQMTMSSVVRNYLRWFELKRCKQAIGPVPLFAGLRTFWQRYVSPQAGASRGGWSLRSDLFAERGSKNNDDTLESTDESSHSVLFADAHGWQSSGQRSETAGNQPELADDHE